MSVIEKRRERFKALHGTRQAFIMPNPFDVGTTRMLEGMRFEALATTSAGFAISQGFKDAEGLLTRDMALTHAQSIVSATTLPVNGDLENGFGDNPEDVVETIRGAIEVGLSGCSIEDYSTDPSRPYYDIDLAVERIEAAAAERDRLSPNFILTARSEAPIETEEDLLETISRLNAFAAAGADCVYAPELINSDHIETVMDAVTAPLNILAGRPNFRLTRKELVTLGVTRVSIGGGLARIAYGAFTAAAQGIKDSGIFSCFDHAEGMDDFDLFLKGRK